MVLLAIAFMAVREFGSQQATLDSRVAGVALVVLLLLGTFLVGHFIQRHGDEIGEARFDMRNKDERER